MITLIFPHQLFQENPAIAPGRTVYLVEEHLFFQQYRFHKQKLLYHRATMRFYADYLSAEGCQVEYIPAQRQEADIRKLVPHLQAKKVSAIHCCQPTDDWLSNRLTRVAEKADISLKFYDSPMFLNNEQEDLSYFSGKKSFHQADFYQQQRLEKDILLDGRQEPLGGKWSFDADNRQKYPRGKKPPEVKFPKKNRFYKEAVSYVEKNFSKNYGQLSDSFIYPTTYAESEAWLEDFLQNRFAEFGPYEDALLADEQILNHSLLTPMLNVGLLTPRQVLERVLEYAEENAIPLNSTEGFIRQMIGWREFIRGVYLHQGVNERTCNYWGFERKIPASFWNAETGIFPVDNVIRKLLETGYCHHIERLMVLGNFMLLCEFDPDEVYRWFMELFIDAYDWVMVPNVYGMSQFADGGLMASKPYISGSNYLMKMSDYPKGDWQQVWDGLFWRFLARHREFFAKNYRMSMLLGTLDKMDESKKQGHMKSAETFLQGLR